MALVRRHGGIGRHKGLKIPRSKIRTGSIPVAGTKLSSTPDGVLLNFMRKGENRYGEIPGSEGSAAGGGRSDLSEWQRSADEEGAKTPTKLSGTATGLPAPS